MALPTQLTNIPVDNDYSMDEAAIIEQLISSGQLSVSQVSDYFGLPAADINRVLSQDFGYTRASRSGCFAISVDRGNSECSCTIYTEYRKHVSRA